MLAKLGLDDSALQCGSPLPSDEDEMAKVISGERPASPLQCDCSGKHTGMIAACLQLGYPIDNYLDPDHPLQQQIRQLVAEACHMHADDLVMATDGCSLPTFGGTLHAFAWSYAELAKPSLHQAALIGCASAMIEVPENVSAQHSLVTDLMRVGAGRIVAKSGAEGLICIGLPQQGLGIAIRVLDGTFRAHPVIVEQVLKDLGVLSSDELDRLIPEDDIVIFNHNRRRVGRRQAAFSLTS